MFKILRFGMKDVQKARKKNKENNRNRQIVSRQVRTNSTDDGNSTVSNLLKISNPNSSKAKFH